MLNDTAPKDATSPKRRILFVDDDPAILRLLQDLLEDHAQKWDMQFVGSAVEALVRLPRWAPNVVVSDLIMPGMDGNALMEQVRRQDPSILRILLSGSLGSLTGASNDKDLRYLPKPLKRAALVAMIEEANSVEALVPDAALRWDIARLTCLPLPRPAERILMGELERSGASLQRVSDLIEYDPGLAALSLRLMRSACLAAISPADRPGQAALSLGLKGLRGLVEAVGSVQVIDPRLQALSDEVSLMGASVATAAREEAKKLGANEAEQDQAFTAGLLHGIGVLVLATLKPELALQAEWPADYAGAGAYLLNLWGLPSPIVNAVAWQQRPELGAPGVVLRALSNVIIERKAIQPCADQVAA